MPCNCDHLEPTSLERESVSVRSYLREVGLKPAGNDDGIYGNTDRLDVDTAALCGFCKTHDLSSYSLELQIWWRDHKKADEEKEIEIARQKRLAKVRKNALKKLTAEEKRALGIKS